MPTKGSKKVATYRPKVPESNFEDVWSLENDENHINQADEIFLVTDDTRGTMTKAEFFGELERLDPEKETSSEKETLPRISFKEIADASNSTPIEEFPRR